MAALCLPPHTPMSAKTQESVKFTKATRKKLPWLLMVRCRPQSMTWQAAHFSAVMLRIAWVGACDQENETPAEDLAVQCVDRCNREYRPLCHHDPSRGCRTFTSLQTLSRNNWVLNTPTFGKPQIPTPKPLHKPHHLAQETTSPPKTSRVQDVAMEAAEPAEEPPKDLKQLVFLVVGFRVVGL